MKDEFGTQTIYVLWFHTLIKVCALLIEKLVFVLISWFLFADGKSWFLAWFIWFQRIFLENLAWYSQIHVYDFNINLSILTP